MIRGKQVMAGILAAGLLTTSAYAAPEKESLPKDAASAGETVPMERPRRGPSSEDQQMWQQMMGSMMGLMVEGTARSMAKPEFAQNMAAFMRNYYKALIGQGFTEEEAMKIVISTGIPQLGGHR